MTKHWVYNKQDETICSTLYAQLQIRPLYCNLLVNRGIRTFAQAKAFFRPELRHLHDPYLMKDMEKAVRRIDRAIQRGEKILVYGDYDVDGTTAVAVVLSFLLEQFPLVDSDFYIPDRYEEGYGLSMQGIAHAKENAFSLIIALDCGVKATTQIAYARSLGIDVIVCDHHLPGDTLPPAHALLNPKQQGCTYPYQSLSGCGIGFKLIQALATRRHLSPEMALRYLDLVATSIGADMVPVNGENRVLASLGLKKINTDPLPAIRALTTLNRCGEPVLLKTLNFVVAPLLNAAGRMEDAKTAVKLLMEKNPEKALERAKELQALNVRRKSLDKAVTAEIADRLCTDKQLAKRSTTVLFAPHWHKGVLGITASRIMETYYRPTVILSGADDRITGSARSVKGFNIYNALTACAHLLESFGGHSFAAGITLQAEKLPAFAEKFEEIVANTLDPALLIQDIEIEGTLTFDDLTEPFYNMLQQFEPHGPENKQPVFLLEKVRDNGYSRLLQSRHIRFELIHPAFPGRSFTGIGFNLAAKFELVASGKPFDLCFSLEKSDFSGKSPLQLLVLDLKESTTGPLSAWPER